jgi:hypothetical protein
MVHVQWTTFLLFSVLGSIIGWNARGLLELSRYERATAKKARCIDTSSAVAPRNPAAVSKGAGIRKITSLCGILAGLIAAPAVAGAQSAPSQEKAGAPPQLETESAKVDDHSYLPPWMRGEAAAADAGKQAARAADKSARRAKTATHRRMKRGPRYAQAARTGWEFFR